MEPAAPLTIERRGSSRAVIRTKKRRLRIFFHSGQVEAFRHGRGAWLLREGWARRGHEAHFNGSLSVAATGEEQFASGCCDHRGHPGHVGVQFVTTRPPE